MDTGRTSIVSDVFAQLARAWNDGEGARYGEQFTDDELEAPAGPLQGTHQALITTLMVRDGDRWKIRHFHNTLVTE
jgi:hypothetical protein